MFKKGEGGGGCCTRKPQTKKHAKSLWLHPYFRIVPDMASESSSEFGGLAVGQVNTISVLNAGRKFSSRKRAQDKMRAYRKNKLFRRIEADIKERDRRRVPGTYVLNSRKLL